MICPICGFDMKEEKTCEKCGFEVVENEQVVESETETDFDALENIEVDFEEVDGEQEVQEDEVSEEVENLEIDFDEINQNVNEKKKSKSSMWGVSLVSFIAGVLATLVVVGSLNGTIISYFDKITNGTPYETVETFCDFYFFANPNADDMVKTFSPYIRAQIVSELAQYGFQNDVDLNFDMTDDAKFKDVANFYINLVNDTTTQITKISSIDFNNIVYYKSDSDEFKTYLEKYKTVDSEANGVVLFADVSFKIKIDVTEVVQETTVPQTSTKKNKKQNKAEATTTTQAVTQTPKTTTDSRIHSCSAVCVKVNDDWKVFSVQVLN